MTPPQSGTDNPEGRSPEPEPVSTELPEMLAALVSSFQDAVISVNLAGLISTWNLGAERLFGYSWHEAVGRTLALVFPPRRLDAEREVLTTALRGTPTTRYETEWLAKGRHAVDVSVSVAPIRSGDGRIVGASVVAFDNTRGKAAQVEMARRMRHLRQGFNNSPIGMALIKPDGTFVEVNDALCSLLGYPRSRLLATTFQAITEPEDLPEELGYVVQVLSGRTNGYHMEKRFVKDDGGRVWVLLSCSSVNASERLRDLLLLQVEDITARKTAEEQLIHQAMHDSLTDLPNRILLFDRTAQAVAAMTRRKTQVAVLFLDLDRFKLINDSFGHDVGDQLLVVVADRLRAIMRPHDTVARIGGDEFVMLCQDLGGEDEVLGIARRVARTLAAPVQLGDLEVVITASIGIAMAGGDGDLPGTLLGNADAARHRAKEAGGDRFEVFDRAMRVRTMARLALENDLRTGIDRGELHLVYQVQVELATGRIRGVEALVRWEHRERGQLAPGEFLPIAEASGLIVPLGRWVLQEACAQAARWRDLAGGMGPMMCVNVSARQLAQRDFAEQVATALASSGLPSTGLCLEITEGTLLDAEHTPPTCEALVASGVCLAIDDFGTGFSSLSYLKRLDVSSIKIDQSFVRGLTPTDTAIVEASVRLAESLQLGSVAEGVETEGHAAYLRACGCQLGQGFYFNQPDPANAVEELIAHRSFETSG